MPKKYFLDIVLYTLKLHIYLSWFHRSRANTFSIFSNSYPDDFSYTSHHRPYLFYLTVGLTQYLNSSIVPFHFKNCLNKNKKFAENFHAFIACTDNKNKHGRPETTKSLTVRKWCYYIQMRTRFFIHTD